MSAEWMALKEWAALADALGRGEIIALVRKGGIREQRAGFEVRHDRFLIYPTYFHEKPDELADRFQPALEGVQARRPGDGFLRIELVADVMAVWKVTELERLPGIANEQGMSWSAIESRFRYRDRPYVHVIAVRASRLSAPVLLPEERRYLGCVSWVKLAEPVAVADAVPVVPTEEFARRLRAVAQRLGEPAESANDASRVGTVPTRG